MSRFSGKIAFFEITGNHLAQGYSNFNINGGETTNNASFERNGRKMETHVFFASGGLKIEGIYHKGDHPRGMVITHPHSLYGGDMHSGVVVAVARVFAEKGYSTLRFNFRGVGRSEGDFDNGVGEQKDVQSAMAYLKERGVAAVGLSGYSFGAWINAQAIGEGVEASEALMVSPPVAFIDFSPISYQPGLKLVITGGRDDIAPSSEVEQMVPRWNPEACFETIAGADHFYSGYLDRLSATISRVFEEANK